MDYLAHAIWSYIFFHKTKRPWIAVLCGIIPDSFSWAIYILYSIFIKGGFGRPELGSIPGWVFGLYNISHSLVTAAVVFLIVYIIFKKIPIYMWAWPIHILIDVPTHSRNFLPTPFLWPISSWTFPGFSWGVWWFMLLNYGLILGFLTWIVWKKFKEKKK